nr:helix-turn-helix domain-containing protein [Streptomyces sp. TLI_053]
MWINTQVRAVRIVLEKSEIRSGAAVRYTTAGLPASRRRAYWREALSETFGSVDTKVPAEVDHGSIHASPLGPLQAVTVEGDAHRAERSRRLIAGSDNEEFVVVKLLNRGTVHVEQNSRESSMAAGQLFMYDMARPIRLIVPERFRTQSLVMPRQALGLGESGLQRITAVPLGGDSPLGRLVGSFLSGLVDTADTYQPHTGASVADHAVSLIRTLAQEQLGQDLREAPDASRMMLLRVQAYINEHLADRNLTPETIARHHHVSLRYLHKIFEHEGLTVSRWIHRRRLEQCHRALGDPRKAGRAIAAVAHDWGFANAPHFSRSFKSVYGVSPREWRSTALSAVGKPDYAQRSGGTTACPADTA